MRLAPLAHEDAHAMISQLRSLVLLERTGADVDALADIAVRVGALAEGHPAVAELDLNPVMVAPEGARVVDARVRVAPPADPAGVPCRGRMKRIGLLGGMSWESTVEYYRLVNELVAQRLGGLHSADCILRSVDFSEIEVLQRENRWAEAGERLAQEAQRLEHSGAELLVLCTNTMHKVAAEIEIAITIPFVHIGDTTAEAVRAADLTTVGLLATGYTMEQDFYRGRLEHHGLNVIVPDVRDRRIVHDVIYDELCRGIVDDGSRDEYRRIMGALADRGAEGILLGCTEIDLLVSQADSPVPVFDTTRLHAEKAVSVALAASPQPST